MLVAIAFTASLVLTGRMRDANEAGAQNQPRTPGARRERARAGRRRRNAARLQPHRRANGPCRSSTSRRQQVVRRDFADPFAGSSTAAAASSRTRRPSNAVGSGVIVSADGYILTNNHVVTGEAGDDVTIEQLDVTSRSPTSASCRPS